MKRKHFKINKSTLFVFQTSRSGETTTVETDPTTTMMTSTVTGIFMSDRKI